MIRPMDAWMLRALMTGRAPNGELQALSEPFHALAIHLSALPLEARHGAWEGFLSGRSDRDALIEALAEAEPDGPPPQAAPTRRTAHLGDLSDANDSDRFVWPRWLVRSHFTLLTSEPKVGKTRLCLEIAKRIYFEECWPDGQAPTFPAGTKTLWVPGDRNQDELKGLATAYGLPLEAALLNTDPENPYGGWSLDDPENVEGMRSRIEAERPAIVFIDTVWRSTRCKLHCANDVNALLDPILTIAQECDTTFFGLMHASKDGETLGRRLEGLARAVIKLTKPGPESQPARRRFWVDRANFLEPTALGVTMTDAGCTFDANPPEADEAPKAGRPPEKLGKAISFLMEKLSQGGRKQCELIDEWIELGESKTTIFNAMKAIQADGRMAIDVDAKPKVCHLVRNEPEGQESDF